MTPWHHTAVVYQIYLRSFADGNGDGVGDIAGLRARLPYLRDLGVDAIWLTPWYVSPMADGGYDVADYRDIDPLFGSLAEAATLIAEAHAHGLRVIIDIVPNHCSDQHPWFTAALRAGPGSAERARTRERPFYDVERGAFVTAAVYDRAKLAAGDRLPGPAVINQFDATTVVLAGQTVTVDSYGILVIEVAA